MYGLPVKIESRRTTALKIVVMGAGPTVTVLMVAEKPSLAKSIAEHLSDGKSRSRQTNLDVHSWNGTFMGMHAMFKMTSVIGHVLSVDFPSEYQSWEKVRSSWSLRVSSMQ